MICALAKRTTGPPAYLSSFLDSQEGRRILVASYLNVRQQQNHRLFPATAMYSNRAVVPVE